jgi:2,4-dienoyl-CoA reductase-like NADH-dependent reductase (Old Yellow Enzyme family)
VTVKLSDSLAFTRGPAMKNRFLLAPLTNMQSHADGTLSDDEFNWLVRRAEGGFAMTMTCAAHVQKGGQGFPGQLGAFSDAHLPGLERLASAIKAHGSVSSAQIQHSGEKTIGDLTGEDVVAPFDNPDLGARAMTTGEVEQLIEDFILAAVRCEKAGFEGIELHGAHGYMLCEFLDAERNQRADGYGGSYENRTRIFRDVIAGIRARTGPDFQLGLRISPERFGIVTAESLRFAEEMMTSGDLDYLDMSLWDCFKTPEDPDYASAPLIDWFTKLKRGTTKLGVAGKIYSAETSQKCLDHGADFVFIGRSSIVQHDFPKRAIADDSYVAQRFPVTREYLKGENVGPAFIHYLAKQWPNYVSD